MRSSSRQACSSSQTWWRSASSWGSRSGPSPGGSENLWSRSEGIPSNLLRRPYAPPGLTGMGGPPTSAARAERELWAAARRSWGEDTGGQTRLLGRGLLLRGPVPPATLAGRPIGLLVIVRMDVGAEHDDDDQEDETTEQRELSGLVTHRGTRGSRFRSTPSRILASHPAGLPAAPLV